MLNPSRTEAGQKVHCVRRLIIVDGARVRNCDDNYPILGLLELARSDTSISRPRRPRSGEEEIGDGKCLETRFEYRDIEGYRIAPARQMKLSLGLFISSHDDQTLLFTYVLGIGKVLNTERKSISN